MAFARANGFDRIVLDGPDARFGIAVRGKAYAVFRQALEEAGITEAFAREHGLRIWKVGLAWPMDAEAARAFADGLEEVLVIEDRRPMLEWQLRDALFHAPARPRVTGKKDEAGRPLLSDLTELDTGQILRALLARLPQALRTERLRARIAELDALAAAQAPPLHLRDPYFCPGCPHNTSTRIPEGSRALAGIGCHYLAKNMDRNSDLFTQMGGEGVPWIGQAPFTCEPHVFANIGDGTWGHSGSLTVRFAVSAKANMTFKILVNGAVAMTGGQTPEGEINVPHIAAQLRAEGVQRIEIVADDPDRHRGDPLIPPGAGFHHRSELDMVQRELRAVKGVSAIIYDQECATERRRKRKRDLAPKAERRVMINPRVCEDCGDCSRASNCLAVEPVETAFGRKRRIDQSGCNQDLSCVQGFCPSFVTLVGARPAEHVAASAGAAPPEPTRPEVQGEAWNLLMAGVGGQGVSSLAAILAQAAHLEGRPVRSLDLLGLAQKGGGVYAQLRIGAVGAAPESIAGARIGAGQADLLVAADMVVAHGTTARPLLGAARTVAVVNADLAPTAQFVKDTGTRYAAAEMFASIRAACRDVVGLPGASRVAQELGDVVFLNVFLLGIAYQRGLVPLSAEAIERALELNGAAVARNKEAFARGRAAALEDLAPPPHVAETIDALVARRVADLTAWQNAAHRARLCGLRRAHPCRRAGGGARRGTPRARRRDAVASPDGLQGRIRGRTPAHAARMAGRAGEGLRRHAAHRTAPGTPHPRHDGPRHRPAAQARLRPMDAASDGLAAPWQGAARHGARPLRPHRGTTDGTRASRRVPRAVGGDAVRALARHPRHGLRVGRGLGRHQGVRPCKGAQPRGDTRPTCGDRGAGARGGVKGGRGRTCVQTSLLHSLPIVAGAGGTR